MEAWLEILYFIGVLFVGWILYSYVRNKPGAFSADNMIKSLYTLGILALALMAFILFCIWLLQNS